MMHAEDVLEQIHRFCIDQIRGDNDIVTQQLINEILFMVDDYFTDEAL